MITNLTVDETDMYNGYTLDDALTVASDGLSKPPAKLVTGFLGSLPIGSLGLTNEDIRVRRSNGWGNDYFFDNNSKQQKLTSYCGQLLFNN